MDQETPLNALAITAKIKCVTEYGGSSSFWGVVNKIRYRCNDGIVTANGKQIGEAETKVEVVREVLKHQREINSHGNI